MKRKIGVNRDFPWNAFENQFTGWKDSRFDQLDWFSRFSLRFRSRYQRFDRTRHPPNGTSGAAHVPLSAANSGR